MKVAKPLAAAVALVALFGVAAHSADLVSLGWGEFTVDADSPTKPKSWDAKAGRDGMDLAMVFNDLTAKADGDVKEHSASMSGHFAVHQPQSVALTNLHIELRGSIVKTAGSTARVDVTVGNAQGSIEWPENEVAAGPFTRPIDVAVEGGQLPNPFTISAVASAKKLSENGAAIVTLEEIKVTAGSANVADGMKQKVSENTVPAGAFAPAGHY
jgi:hypothetical protein